MREVGRKGKKRKRKRKEIAYSDCSIGRGLSGTNYAICLVVFWNREKTKGERALRCSS